MSLLVLLVMPPLGVVLEARPDFWGVAGGGSPRAGGGAPWGGADGDGRPDALLWQDSGLEAELM